MEKDNVLFFIDRKSFPVNCPELDDFVSLLKGDYSVMQFNEESPTKFFRKAVELSDDYELIIPVTRNMYVRDRLRMEGVNLVICL